jgi:hypothetical protein
LYFASLNVIQGWRLGRKLAGSRATDRGSWLERIALLSTGETTTLLALLSEDWSMENHVSAFTVTFKRHQHFALVAAFSCSLRYVAFCPFGHVAFLSNVVFEPRFVRRDVNP